MIKVLSLVVVSAAAFMLFSIFGPILKQEVTYSSNKMTGVRYSLESEEDLTLKKGITPANLDFSITIPKLNVTTPVTADVDSMEPEEYLEALKNGIAHAAGTAYPGKPGNSFLFAHSADSIWDVGDYNAIYFLMGHLENGDEIDIYYKGRLYTYYVYDKKVIKPEDVYQYTNFSSEEESTLTLQTGYPAGTTVKRLIILAKEGEVE